jgi:hypothetical protein
MRIYYTTDKFGKVIATYDDTTLPSSLKNYFMVESNDGSWYGIKDINALYYIMQPHGIVFVGKFSGLCNALAEPPSFIATEAMPAKFMKEWESRSYITMTDEYGVIWERTLKPNETQAWFHYWHCE